MAEPRWTINAVLALIEECIDAVLDKTPEEALISVLKVVGERLSADRMVVALRDGRKRYQMISGFGPNLPTKKVLIQGIPDRVRELLEIRDFVIDPTPGVGFDYYAKLGTNYVLMVDDTSTAREFGSDDHDLLERVRRILEKML